MFKRPEVTSNERFDCRRAAVRRSSSRSRSCTVAYDGKVVVLDDPLQLADPKAAFTQNPYAEASVDLTYTRVSDMFGGEPDEPHEKPGEEFAKGHYEQLIAGTRIDPGGRRGVGHRRLRPARPLVGTAVLAGALVLPVAHGQRRRRLRVHGEPHRPARRRRARGAASSGRTASSTSATTAELTHGVDRRGRRTTRRCPGTLRSSRSDRGVDVQREGGDDGAAAQPPPGPRRRVAADPDRRGPHRVDDRGRRRRSGRAGACRSTSTRSSTAARSASPSSDRPRRHGAERKPATPWTEPARHRPAGPAGEQRAALAAPAHPVHPDAGVDLDESFDATLREQHLASVGGAVDGEHDLDPPRRRPGPRVAGSRMIAWFLPYCGSVATTTRERRRRVRRELRGGDRRHVVAAVAGPTVAAFELGVGHEVFGLDRSELVDPWYEFRARRRRPTSRSPSPTAARPSRRRGGSTTSPTPTPSSSRRGRTSSASPPTGAARRAARRPRPRRPHRCRCARGAFLLADGRPARRSRRPRPTGCTPTRSPAGSRGRRRPRRALRRRRRRHLHVGRHGRRHRPAACTSCGSTTAPRSPTPSPAGWSCPRTATAARRSSSPRPVPDEPDDDTLAPTLDWALEHLDEPLTVEDLARRALDVAAHLRPPVPRRPPARRRCSGCCASASPSPSACSRPPSCRSSSSRRGAASARRRRCGSTSAGPPARPRSSTAGPSTPSRAATPSPADRASPECAS